MTCTEQEPDIPGKATVDQSILSEVTSLPTSTRAQPRLAKPDLDQNGSTGQSTPEELCSVRQQSPNFLAPGTSFVEDIFSHRLSGGGGWSGDDSSTLHLLCALFLLLILHQSYLQSSGIRSWRLETSALNHILSNLLCSHS